MALAKMAKPSMPIEAQTHHGIAGSISPLGVGRDGSGAGVT